MSNSIQIDTFIEAPERAQKMKILASRLNGGMSILYFLQPTNNKTLVIKIPKGRGKEKIPSYDPGIESSAFDRISSISIQKNGLSIKPAKCHGIIKFKSGKMDPEEETSTVSIEDIELAESLKRELLGTTGILIEYYDGYTSLENLDKSKLPAVLEIILEFISKLIKKGVATRDLKSSNFLFKQKADGSIEIIFIDLSMCVIENGGSTSKFTDFGTLTTSFPPNFEIEEDRFLSASVPFPLEVLSMRWSAAMMCFQLLFDKYPFILESAFGTFPQTMEELKRKSPLLIIDAITKLNTSMTPISPGNSTKNFEIFYVLQQKLITIMEEFKIWIAAYGTKLIK